MAQNIYDDPAFFAAYTQLRRQVIGLDGAPEWPTVRAMLPPRLAGMRVLDLGCGFGWFSRWARQNGAASVLGIDLSENMIARARAMTSDDAIEYRIADLDHLDVDENAFDLAYSSLALHYIVDFDRLTRTIHRALNAGGHFVFTIEHPIFMAPKRPGWSVDSDGRRTWPISDYSREGSRTTDWLRKGVVKYHRTLATTLNTLLRQGFTICQVEEFAPTPAQVAAEPELAAEIERPVFLMVSARR